MNAARAQLTVNFSYCTIGDKILSIYLVGSDSFKHWNTYFKTNTCVFVGFYSYLYCATLIQLLVLSHINNNVTKDRCPIPMDTTVRIGPLKFSLHATIDHHGPSIHSGHYTASINCCKKFYCNDHTVTEFGITDKISSTAYVILYKLIGAWFLDSNRWVGVWLLPWRWHILSILLTAGRGTSAETCGLDDVLPPDDLGSRPEALC